jgi:hypothetical protein
MNLQLEKKSWWGYIEEDLQELLVSSEFLVNVVKGWGGDLPGGKQVFHDYSFVVFPAAKAYEGFLKKMFLDLKFITEEDYYGKKFRIGKALNPYIDKKYKNRNSVYDKLVNFCESLPAQTGKDLADTLWDAWVQGRNLVFHWFPNEKRAVSFVDAQSKISIIINAMDKCFKGCKLK